MESLSEVVTIGLGIFFFCYCFLYMRSNGRNKYKLPPGPRPWPVIGSLHLLGKLPHQSLTTLAKKYGSIMFLRLGSIPTVVVSSPAMAKEFLKTHDLVFANRSKSTYGKYVCYDHKSVAFGPYGASWKQMRKLLTVELLTMKRNDSFRFVREEEVSDMIASIWQESRQGAQCVDVKKRLSSLTRNIVCRMFASRTYADNELNGGHDFKQIVEEMFVLAGAFCIGDFIPSLDWLDFQGFRRRMQAVHKIFDGFAEKVIDEHIHHRLEKEKPKEEDRVKDMVDVMLGMAETKNLTISRIDIKAMILDMLNAGTETSVTLIEWAMSELLKNPATLARAQQEIESAVGRDRRVMESDVMSLDYLRCVVKETLRLHAPAPMLLNESTEGCSVGGYFIPPKTRLFVNVWAIGRDENVWKDVHQFKPERFMGCNKDVRCQDFDLLPFGAGRRGCPGISMGLSVSELALAQLIHCFEWNVNGEVDMEEEFELTVPRKNPLFACPKWRLTTEYPS
ncbi:cytochrome P450 71AU50 [Cryptomeria japonica]|uniref:cytochrome P450 71AU50 n=1 Tax=Cryptomeria japonica TaxID=3369 RepID=UPI0027DA204D|nr:cytochrome P450 71AU50 [Cryptomeria japonica]